MACGTLRAIFISENVPEAFRFTIAVAAVAKKAFAYPEAAAVA